MWVYHIIPHCPIEFLYVCKQWRSKAFALLNKDPRMVKKKVYRALKHAALTNNIPMLQLILAHPLANITCGSQYPIRAAASSGHVELVKFLLRVPGVNPGSLVYKYKQPKNRPEWKKQFTWTAIEGALRGNYIDIVDLILDAFPALGNDALKRAVELGKAQLVTHVLDNLQKYAINMRAHDYLHLSLPHPDIFEALLRVPNIQLDRSFMDCCKKKEHIALTRALLDDPRLNLQTLSTYEQGNLLAHLAGCGDVDVMRKVLTLVHPTVRPSDEVVNAATHALDYEMTRMLFETPQFKKTGNWGKRCSNCVDTTKIELGNKLLELVLAQSEFAESDIKTAVELAAKNNNVPALEMLFKYVPETVDLHSAIKLALTNKAESSAVFLLTQSRVDATFDNNYYVRYASEKGLSEVVKVLLKIAAVNPGVAQNSALRAACVTGNLEVVKALLADPRVNPADFTNHAIQVASLSGHVDIVKALLEDARVNPSVNNNYALKVATQRGHTEIAELLTSSARFKK